MDEFLELSALITEVGGIPGLLCVDCAMLDRPNVSANWSLGHDDPVPRRTFVSAWATRRSTGAAHHRSV